MIYDANKKGLASFQNVTAQLKESEENKKEKMKIEDKQIEKSLLDEWDINRDVLLWISSQIMLAREPYFEYNFYCLK